MRFTFVYTAENSTVYQKFLWNFCYLHSKLWKKARKGKNYCKKQTKLRNLRKCRWKFPKEFEVRMS